MPGVSTTLALYPAENVAVVVLTSKTNRSMPRIAEELVAAVIPKYETALREERRQPRPAPPRLRFEPVSGLVGRWAGSLVTWQQLYDMDPSMAENGPIYPNVSMIIPGERYREIETREALAELGIATLMLVAGALVVLRRRPG